MDLFLAYVVCFAAGLLFAVISAVGGHAFGDGTDAGGAEIGSGGHAEAGFGGDSMPGLSPLSPTTIASFVTAFGGIGMILSRIEATRSPWVSLPLSLLGGIGVGFVVFLLFRAVFVRIQSSSESRVGSLPGRPATVITPIAADGVGEIAYVDGGVRYTASARSEDGASHSNGETVVIRRVVGTQIYVAKD
ncbi:MAG: NfeD family protein [Verrucomicrobiales bacterium]|nr:NfeD family protein [Verrucomicrobiales bacterium]